MEFHRRRLVLELVRRHCGGTRVVDIGASPFITSCALRAMGYEVVAVDYDPSEYEAIAEACGVKTAKADLERDRVPIEVGWADCAVFTEVIEHVNPYHVGHTLAEINRTLKPHGRLILTTPNIPRSLEGLSCCWEYSPSTPSTYTSTPRGKLRAYSANSALPCWSPITQT